MLINKNKKANLDGFSKFWDVVLTCIVGLFAFACVFPFIFVVIQSFTDEDSLTKNGYRLIPKKWSLKAYDYVIHGSGSLVNAYGVTIFITVVGTALGVFIMALFAYAISRKNFKYRKIFTFYAFFTMLFSGGMVPGYIVVTQILNLKDSVWALILPMCCGAMNILILKTFFRTAIPDAIVEAARIDGASEFRVFIQIALPIALPGIATVALFTTIGYWNDWFNALLYIETDKLFPLQYLLMKIQNSMAVLRNNIAINNSTDTLKALQQMPQETARMAMIVLAIGPIVLAYPFFQRFFIQGLTIGAVKE